MTRSISSRSVVPTGKAFAFFARLHIITDFNATRACRPVQSYGSMWICTRPKDTKHCSRSCYGVLRLMRRTEIMIASHFLLKHRWYGHERMQRMCRATTTQVPVRPSFAHHQATKTGPLGSLKPSAEVPLIQVRGCYSKILKIATTAWAAESHRRASPRVRSYQVAYPR